MSFLRYLMLLSLASWLGGLIFFSFVVAPTAFSVLPTRHLAGAVVARSLGALHWIGIISGLVFLITSMLYARLNTGEAQLLTARHILILIMLGLTCISQFGISPKMHAIRASVGEIDNVPVDNPERVQFNALHGWSTRLEGGVFLLALVVAYLTAQQMK
jgi:putative copper export protein